MLVRQTLYHLSSPPALASESYLKLNKNRMAYPSLIIEIREYPEGEGVACILF
jgi:hypothetical protein